MHKTPCFFHSFNKFLSDYYMTMFSAIERVTFLVEFMI